MKKTKLLVLTAMAALTLTGCGGNGSSKGGLPSGGKAVDVTTEEGAKSLNDHVKDSKKAYEDLDLSSFSVSASVSDVNLNLKAKGAIPAEEEGATAQKIELEVSAKDFGGKAEVKAAKHAKGAGEDYDSLDASLALSTTGGSLAIKGSLPGMEEGKTAKLDSSLNVKGLNANAYLSGSKAYYNISGNEGIFKNLDLFTNKLYSQVQNSMFGVFLSLFTIPEDIFNAETSTFKFADFYNSFSPKKGFIDLGEKAPWPTIDLSGNIPVGDYSINLDDIDLAATLGALKQNGFDVAVKTYGDLSFGFDVSLTKESIKSFVKQIVPDEDYSKEIDETFKKCSVEASVFFNKKGLLESAGFSCDLDVSPKDLSAVSDYLAIAYSMFEDFSVDLTLKGSSELKVNYNNVRVDLPSDLAKYEEVKIFAA